MRMEGIIRATDGERSFLTHTGPYGGSDFSFDISLLLDLSIEKATWDIDVVMDINQLYEEPTFYDFNESGSWATRMRNSRCRKTEQRAFISATLDAKNSTRKTTQISNPQMTTMENP